MWRAGRYIASEPRVQGPLKVPLGGSAPYSDPIRKLLFRVPAGREQGGSVAMPVLTQPQGNLMHSEVRSRAFANVQCYKARF